MFKGTNASAGIGIGKAAIIKENELVIRPEKVIDGAAEVERLRERWLRRLHRRRRWQQIWQQE